MMQSRFGLKLLGLCALLVGVMSIGAGAAQAEPGAFWLVSAKKISTELLPEFQAEIENKTGTLLYIIGGKKIHLLCTAVTLEEAHLLEPNGGLLGKAVFTGCIFLELLAGGGTKEIKACNPKEGKILTNRFRGLIKLHEGKGRILLTPFEGTTFASIFLGEECAFGETLKIGGELVVKDCKDAFLTDQVTHLFEEDNVLTKLWVNTEANPATIDGSLNLFLSGAHIGLTWAGHPA